MKCVFEISLSYYFKTKTVNEMKHLQGKLKVYLSFFLIKHYAMKIYILNL